MNALALTDAAGGFEPLLLPVGADGHAQVADAVESDGRATALKLEGIEPRPGSSSVFDVVADMDRPDQPAWLAESRVGDGPQSGTAGLLES